MDFPLHSAFVAVPLGGDSASAFAAAQESLAEHADILRFQKPDSPHLTLTFWKEMMEIEYHQVLAQAKNVADASSPFLLRVTGADLFSRRGDDRVLFLDVAFSPELATLKKRCPWPNPPDQPFRPHITLARITHPQRFVRARKDVMKTLKNLAFPVTVDRLALYANIGGVSQTRLREFPFPR